MNSEDEAEYLDAAREAALKAGEEVLLVLGSDDRQIEYKGELDLVTEMDRHSESLIKEFLARSFPHVAVLAEEGGASGDSTGAKWIIDPIDGTTSYAHGLPHFAVSIGLEVEGEIRVGVVYNPPLKECFTAIKGQGAYLNGKRIKVSKTGELKRSLLATGFPYDRKTSPDNNLDKFSALLMEIQGIRRMGSAALDLCYTAAGRFDGYWEMKLKPWDTAAGFLILTEAGGTITDFSGNEYSIYGDELLASNGRIHNQMISVLKELK